MRYSQHLHENQGASEYTLTTGMKMVLRSDFVNRKRAVTTFLIIEMRDAKVRMLDFRLSKGGIVSR